jgi:hypothetical protein
LPGDLVPEFMRAINWRLNMTWVPQITAELKLRSGLMPNELHDWQRDADANVNGAGIHQSQVAAINILFDELEKTQAGVLAALVPAVDLPTFKRKRLELEQQLTGTHGILSIFRFVLGQRKDPRYYRATLDFADLVAADCYRPCLERAAGWNAIDAKLFRAPPLTYLNTLLSPAAFTSRHAFGAFKMPIEGNSELKLPISIVSLPFHHTSAIWTFCALHHEVGHIIDQDLGVYESIRPLMEATIAEDRKSIWVGWLREMIADSFGVLLGHAGYAQLLAKMLLLPDALVTEPNPADKHPTPYIRIMLLAALLKTTGVPQLSQLADAVTMEWREAYAEPPALKPFVDDCGAVANLLMNSGLPALKNHTIRDFASTAEISSEHAATMKLAGYLRMGKLRPQPADLRARLVPVAAQVAVSAVTENYDEKGAVIHERAVEYMSDLRATMPNLLGPEDEFLAGRAQGASGAAREQHYRQLVRDLNFSTLNGSEE